MPNTEGETRTIAYARECNPTKSDDWWHVKRATFGGDDGVEFISLADIDGLLIPATDTMQAEQLIIDLSPQRFVITIQWETGQQERARSMSTTSQQDKANPPPIGGMIIDNFAGGGGASSGPRQPLVCDLQRLDFHIFCVSVKCWPNPFRRPRIHEVPSDFLFAARIGQDN
jgi:Protein of unknown function (DUF3085)